jgi:hypothetical protein
MREAHCDEGNGKTVLARSENFAAPSTLWESGHFYFAPTDISVHEAFLVSVVYNCVPKEWDIPSTEVGMKINWTRVILGGLLAGLIVNVCEYIVNSLILGSEWAAAMKALNKSPAMGIGPTAAFWLWGFLIGIYALSLYAAIRPRFGPGPKTAVIAGIGVWVPASLLAMIAPAALHLFGCRLIAIGVVLGLVEIVVGTVVGAWLYKEQEVPSGASAAAVDR